MLTDNNKHFIYEKYFPKQIDTENNFYHFKFFNYDSSYGSTEQTHKS